MSLWRSFLGRGYGDLRRDCDVVYDVDIAGSDANYVDVTDSLDIITPAKCLINLPLSIGTM